MEHFIEAVRRFPCLWNTAAIEYRDQELKDAAWAEVSRETNLGSIKDVKLKWKKLRDSYRDALKRQNECAARAGGAGGGVEAAPARRQYPWKYMGLMEFLQPHMSNRKKSEQSLPRAQPGAAGGGHNRASSATSESEAESEPAPPPEPRSKRRRRSSPPPPLPPQAPQPTPQPPQPDPLDIFFSSMCQSTKRLPFATQLKIKRQVFAAVVEAEEALLAEQASYAALWAGGGSGAGGGAGGAAGTNGTQASSSSSDEDDRKP